MSDRHYPVQVYHVFPELKSLLDAIDDVQAAEALAEAISKTVNRIHHDAYDKGWDEGVGPYGEYNNAGV